MKRAQRTSVRPPPESPNAGFAHKLEDTGKNIRGARGAQKFDLLSTLKDDSKNQTFAQALDEALKSATKKGLGDLSTNDLTPFSFQFKGQPVETNFLALTTRIGKNLNLTKAQSKSLLTHLQSKNSYETSLLLCQESGFDLLSTLKDDSKNQKFVQALNEALKSATKKGLEDLSTTDRPPFSFQFEGQSVETNFLALITRIGKNLNLTQAQSKSLLTHLQAQKSFEDALKACKPSLEALDILSTLKDDSKNQAFAQTLNEALKSATGKGLEDLSTNDQTPFSFQFEGQPVETNFLALTARIGKNLNLTKAQSKSLLTHLQAQKSFEGALKACKPYLKALDLLSTLKDDSKNQKFVQALDAALKSATGKGLGGLSTKDKTPFSFQFEGQSVETNFLALTDRIRYNLDLTQTQAKSLLVHLQAKNSYEKSLRLCQESGFDLLSTLKDDSKNQKFVQALSEAIKSATGKGLWDASTGDQTPFSFQFEGQSVETNFLALTARIGKNLNLTQAQSKSLLVHLQAKNPYEKSLRLCQESGFDLLSTLKDDSKNQTFAQALDEALKSATKKGLGELSTNDRTSFSFQFEGQPVETNFSALTQRIGKNLNLTKAQSKSLLIHLQSKKPFQTALQLAQTPLSQEEQIQADLEILKDIGAKEAQELLGHDPLLFKYYLVLTQPELIEEEVDRLTASGFKGLRFVAPNGGGGASRPREDVCSLLELLSSQKQELIDSLATDPVRYQLLSTLTERMLIKQFVPAFNDGERHIQNLAKTQTQPAFRNMLHGILQDFRQVEQMPLSNVRDDRTPYFFQKYSAYKIQQALQSEKPGIILANEPGLGKTFTTLAAINGHAAAIIAPNSVVSAWREESDRFLKAPSYEVLQEMHSDERKRVLASTTARHVITNIEFLQKPEDTKRFELLSREILVMDEGHSVSNPTAKQIQGAKQIVAAFKLIVSASPYKNPESLRQVMAFIYPKDVRFSSGAAFRKAFPKDDSEALRLLHRMAQEHVIRFRKSDVLLTMDPSMPPEQQRDRLPMKVHIPPEIAGTFTLTAPQCDALLKMFTDWEGWVEQYSEFYPKTHAAKTDRVWEGNQLVKKHALRQLVNNPAKAGRPDLANPKEQAMLGIVRQCLLEERKVVIFCQYIDQANAYFNLLKAQGIESSLFTGEVSARGYSCGPNGLPLTFRKGVETTWALDENGYPLEDRNGEPMSQMDYERHAFQNAPRRKVLIATYQAGAVGTTFTAAKATIFDDLPNDFIQAYQAEDRNHRIDPDHPTHYDVQYFRLVAAYPQEFLEEMKHRWIHADGAGIQAVTRDRGLARRENLPTAHDKYFKQGSYDQVMERNLKAQEGIFQLINDGIVEESALAQGMVQFSGVDIE